MKAKPSFFMFKYLSKLVRLGIKSPKIFRKYVGNCIKRKQLPKISVLEKVIEIESIMKGI